MKKLITTCLLCLAALVAALAEDGKYHDKDVVLDEAMVPPYDLPPVLVTSEGKPVTTPEEWFHIRRPQIMSLFGNLIYGIVPAPQLEGHDETLVPPDGRAEINVPRLPRGCPVYLFGIIKMGDGSPERVRAIHVVRDGKVVRKLSLEDIHKLPLEPDGHKKLTL